MRPPTAGDFKKNRHYKVNRRKQTNGPDSDPGMIVGVVHKRRLLCPGIFDVDSPGSIYSFRRELWMSIYHRARLSGDLSD
jgi:hypothetical protein